MIQTNTASQVITTGKGKLLSVQVVTDAAKSGRVKIYDGQDSNGKLIVNVASTGYGCESYMPYEPIEITSGIYALVETDILSYTVEYM
jgi:hypothetical protein